jgi:hypothetical protein
MSEIAVWTTVAMVSTNSPPLLRIPVELRFAIYDHLIFPKNNHLRLQDSSVMISYDPPPCHLLLTCHQLCQEVLTHYYSHVNFTFWAEPDSVAKWDSPDEKLLAILRNIRTMSLGLGSVLMKQQYERKEPGIWPPVFIAWVDKLVPTLLRESKNLKVLTIQVAEMPLDHMWETKKELVSLRPVRDKVCFVVQTPVAFVEDVCFAPFD